MPILGEKSKSIHQELSLVPSLEAVLLSILLELFLHLEVFVAALLRNDNLLANHLQTRIEYRSGPGTNSADDTTKEPADRISLLLIAMNIGRLDLDLLPGIFRRGLTGLLNGRCRQG